MAPMTGFRGSKSAKPVQRCRAEDGSRAAACGRAIGPAAQVRAGAKRTTVPGQYRDADVVAVPDLAKRLRETLGKLTVDAVELGRPVERDRRHARVHLEDHRRIGLWAAGFVHGVVPLVELWDEP